jgi:hypothetical protein
MRTVQNNEDNDDPGLQAPARLVSALNRVPQEHPFVPPAVDEAVFRAARQHLNKPESPRKEASGLASLCQSLHLHWGWKGWLGTATAAIVALLLASQFRQMESRRSASMHTGPNPAKRLDILDALKLAKRLQAGPVSEPRWDLNRDGVVDERDVRAIAVEAVRLDKGGRS